MTGVMSRGPLERGAPKRLAVVIGAGRLAVALVLALSAGAIGAGAIGAGAQGSSDVVGIRLASQTPWVTPGQEFDLRFHLTPATASGGTVVVTVFSAIPNRSEFTRTLIDKIDEFVLARPLAVPLDSLAPDAAGARDIRIPLQDPARPRDRSKLLLPHTGVYPVRVEYRPENGPTVDVVTHVLFLGGPVSGAKLNVTWIVPVHAPPHPGPDGTDVLTAEESTRLAYLANALDAHRGLPVVLAPTPDTLDALASSPREQDRSTLASLARPQAGRQVVTSTYVPVSLPGMLAAGLADDATLQLTQGSDVLARTLDIRPDGRTWVENGSLDEASANFLRGEQVDRMVIPDAELSPNPFPVTLTQPFELTVGPGVRIRAVAADPGLAAHFADSADPVLAAHQLLADLTVLYLDRPGQTRGVVAVSPLSWMPDPSFLATFLDGLASSPVLSAATLDTLFNDVPPALRGNAVLGRTLLADPRVGSDAASFPTDAIRAAHHRLDGFGSALNEDNPLYGRFEHILLTCESSDLVDSRSRQAQLDVVNRRIDAQLALIQLPSSRKITLTARTGRLPITILSGADYPIRVLLRLDSDKLSFPGRGSRGTVTQLEELRKGNNAADFTVRARTAGAFPLHISLVAPNGALVLASTTFTVQSTALSGVGVVLSVGAAAFLALWWGRRILLGRRSHS